MKHSFIITILILQVLYASSQSPGVVTYKEKSKLEWADFNEVATGTDSLRSFNFNASIQMKSVKVNVWTGVATFEANGMFRPANSWIQATSKTAALLDYFQLQYDITDAVAKELEKDINSKRLNGGNKKRMDKIFKEYNDRINRILVKMDVETESGKNLQASNEWKDKLKNGMLTE